MKFVIREPYSRLVLDMCTNLCWMRIDGGGVLWSLDSLNLNVIKYMNFLLVFSAVFVLLYALIAAISMVVAAGILHGKMLSNILRSPMSFFDTTPIGRILNRFSRDIETIDNVLPQLIRSFMNTFFSVASTIVVISYSTPIFLSVVVPLGLLYYFVQVSQ